MPELRWKAHYRDDTELRQVAPDGSKNAYHDIDQANLSAFQLLDGENVVVDVPFSEGERLVWRRRTEIMPGVGSFPAHVIGKRRKVSDGFEVSSVICIAEHDLSVISADDFLDNHPWLYPPQLMEHES
jgi:hypothetical protein